MTDMVGEFLRLKRPGFPDRRNPVEVLHETHTGRLKVRDRYGYTFRLDPDETALDLAEAGADNDRDGDGE